MRIMMLVIMTRQRLHTWGLSQTNFQEGRRTRAFSPCSEAILLDISMTVV
ncbi:hypothetical protein A2U01_0063004, partial [Trifolium medium]|nr:hypothetical protein [Trifolium medium]